MKYIYTIDAFFLRDVFADVVIKYHDVITSWKIKGDTLILETVEDISHVLDKSDDIIEYVKETKNES